MNAPTVTVAIPFFNSESTIAYAIESVLAQEFTDFELLLVNDGSTDGGVKAVRRYLDGQRVRLVDDCSNLGLAPRLNEIAALARGRYLARMDADDIMHPARLRRQVEYLDAHPDVDLVGTGAYFIDTDYSIIERRITRHVRLCRKFSYLQLFHPTVTGRLEWFRDNPYSGQFLRSEDMELWRPQYRFYRRSATVLQPVHNSRRDQNAHVVATVPGNPPASLSPYLHGVSVARSYRH